MEVQQYIVGPIYIQNGLDGTVTDENATMAPQNMQWWAVGGKLYIPTQSTFKFPNPLKPEVWPKASVGPTFYWDSFMFFAAEIADLENWTDMKKDMVEFMKNRTPATAEPE